MRDESLSDLVGALTNADRSEPIASRGLMEGDAGTAPAMESDPEESSRPLRESVVKRFPRGLDFRGPRFWCPSE